MTATGEVHWGARQETIGPNGRDGSPGIRVGAGGLVGRIDASPKAFDIGARTQLFRYRASRPWATYAPPPIRMSTEGHLWLGFKDFRTGSNTGGFEVTIRRVK